MRRFCMQYRTQYRKIQFSFNWNTSLSSSNTYITVAVGWLTFLFSQIYFLSSKYTVTHGNKTFNALLIKY